VYVYVCMSSSMSSSLFSDAPCCCVFYVCGWAPGPGGGCHIVSFHVLVRFAKLGSRLRVSSSSSFLFSCVWDKGFELPFSPCQFVVLAPMVHKCEYTIAHGHDAQKLLFCVMVHVLHVLWQMRMFWGCCLAGMCSRHFTYGCCRNFIYPKITVSPRCTKTELQH
jgi:hypothetical protein